MRTFLSHSSRDSDQVLRIAMHLRRDLDLFFYEEFQNAQQGFMETIAEEIERMEAMVVFVGSSYTESKYQLEEVRRALDRHPPVNIIVVPLVAGNSEPSELPLDRRLRQRPFLAWPTDSPPTPMECAQQIVDTLLQRPLTPGSGLPANPNLFSYEKDILEFYREKLRLGRRLFEESATLDTTSVEWRDKIVEKLREGSPPDWPEVPHMRDFDTSHRPKTNHLSDIGKWRETNARVSAAALQIPQSESPFRFPEAGPRRELWYPRTGQALGVAILVSGGIAPGINAVVDAIVQRHYKYAGIPPNQDHTVSISGFINGFHGLTANPADIRDLVPDLHTVRPPGVVSRPTRDDASAGGSILGTFRMDELLESEEQATALQTIYDRIRNFDIVYIIGGDGSMKAAHALSLVARNDPQPPLGRPVSIVTIPKTMDNDILWVWQSFGFLSAVEKAREIIDQLHTEVISNPRLCILQLFGSDSGFVVSHAVAASEAGHCDLALIPEVEFTMQQIASFLKERIAKTNRLLPHAVVVMAENAIPLDAMTYLNEAKLTGPERKAITEFDERRRNNKRIQGQTSDALRSAGLKIVSSVLPRLLKEKPPPGAPIAWHKLRVLTNEPRHLLRAIPPSTSDIIMGQRLGALAVDNAMAGYTDFMISQWLTEFVLVPLELTVLGRKRIPETGIFWKSVLAKTQQWTDLTELKINEHPGTQGPISRLRRPVHEFEEGGNLESYLQALINDIDTDKRRTLIVGSDGRYFTRRAIQKAIRVAIGNDFQRIVVGRDGLLSTPGAALWARAEKAHSIVFTAGRSPGGPGGDFGIKVHDESGVLVDQRREERIRTTAGGQYKVADSLDIDLKTPGYQNVGRSAVVQVVDPVQKHADRMENIFDFGRLKELFSKPSFAMRFDAMNGVTGSYAFEIFQKRLGAEEGTVMNASPEKDFGGRKPDPTPENLDGLMKLMQQRHAPPFAAAADGDGGRCIVMGPGLVVNPCDSLAIIANNANLLNLDGSRCFARSLPTSRAVDAVAERHNLQVTPTGWSFLARLLAKGEVLICGEESCGVGSVHNPEKDALWTVLAWLTIIEATGKPITEIVKGHWRRFGRHFYQRHDYHGLPTRTASDLFEYLRGQLGTISGKKYGNLEVEKSMEFTYPIEGRELPRKGIEIELNNGCRVVFRVSETATRDHTLRVYHEKYEADSKRHSEDLRLALKDVIEAARLIAELDRFVGNTEPVVFIEACPS